MAPLKVSWEMIGGSEVGDPGSHGQIILQIPCGVAGRRKLPGPGPLVALVRADILDDSDIKTGNMCTNTKLKERSPSLFSSYATRRASMVLRWKTKRGRDVAGLAVMLHGHER